LKRIIILSLIMLLSFIVIGCSNNNPKVSNSNNSNKENTLTCKWSRDWNGTEYKDLSIEIIFNFNSSDELIRVNENQTFDNSHTTRSIPSNTQEIKEKLEEIKYIKVDVNINKSNKDMFYNYTIDVDSIKKDLNEGIITPDFYKESEYTYYSMFPIVTFEPEILKEYIHYNKETLKVKLITDFNFNCK